MCVVSLRQIIGTLCDARRDYVDVLSGKYVYLLYVSNVTQEVIVEGVHLHYIEVVASKTWWGFSHFGYIGCSLYVGISK